MIKLSKNHLFYLLLTNFTFLVLPFTTRAVEFEFDPGGLLQTGTGLGNQDPVIIVGYLVNWVLSILGLVALVLIIYAGFRWMLSRGNEEEVTKAKDILKAAIIGLVIILSSYGIANYIFSQIVSMTIN